MKINSKDYKIHLVKTLFKSKKVILFGHSPFKNNSKWLKLEQFLKTNKCLSYRIPNKLLKISLKNNIFRFLTNWVHGPILIIELNDPTLFYQITKKFKVSAIKIDNKIYSTIDYLEQPGKLKENIRDNLFNPILLSKICSDLNKLLTVLSPGRRRYVGGLGQQLVERVDLVALLVFASSMSARKLDFFDLGRRFSIVKRLLKRSHSFAERMEGPLKLGFVGGGALQE